MKRFWKDVIRLVAEALAPSHIIEIGADTGINTRNILEFCKDNDCKLTSIDPKPSYDLDAYRDQYKQYYSPILKMSLVAIRDCSPAEMVLIDGDHNWYTVLHELIEIEKLMSERFPLVIFHDTGWPYGRRDMYYNPSNIPPEFIQPYRKAGLAYGQSALCASGGFNTHLHHATESGTPKNGVLTAIEDFYDQSPLKLAIRSYQGLNGLTFLYLSDDQRVNRVLDSIRINERLNNLLEEERIQSSIEVAKDMAGLKSRIEALGKDSTEKDKHIQEKDKHIQEKDKHIQRIRHQISNLQRENAQIRELAQSMRIKNRIKRLLRLPDLKREDLQLVWYSLRNDGPRSTLVKIKNRLRGESPGKKYNPGHGESRVIRIASRSVREIEKTLSSTDVAIPSYTPLVTIIVLTRNGKEYLVRLFDAIEQNTLYPHHEIIVVDNASTDDSVEFLESLKDRYSLKIIKNSENVSYSKGHNQAVEIADGEYLVLLNNDVEPLRGWLCHLVSSLQKERRAGAVGGQLIYPDDPQEPLRCRVQHSGIAFDYEYAEVLGCEFLRPYNLGVGDDPKIETQPSLVQRIALTGACLLVTRALYLEAGGLDERYVYGYEDVDFSLKLHQMGYRNIYCAASILVHHESSTQKRQPDYEVRERRTRNIKVLNQKWFDYLYQNYFAEKLKFGDPIFAGSKLHIAFAVTDAGLDVAAGDYFTALELAEALRELGYTVSFVKRRGGDWYDLDPDIDILISMLDAFDLGKITENRKKLITIAWVRNWLDRWLQNPSISEYDLILASSQTLCEILASGTGREVILFPIASNSKRFSRQDNQNDDFTSDYAFTGNYWGKPRDIEKMLNPEQHRFSFALYGKDWDSVKKLRPYYRGFLNYPDIPKVYANTKVVIDDAVAGITKPYGSVNSRVFDATAAGALVLTNGAIGAQELFGDLMPVWENEQQLNLLLDRYLSDDTERENLVKKLGEIVLREHTYRKRAELLLEKLQEFLGLKKTIAIKLPIPSWDEAERWGDFHLGRGLKKYFERMGYSVLLQVLPEWENLAGDQCDVVIVLRGLSRYHPKSHQINFLWNISHPDKICIDEYNSYDKVFVASDTWVRELCSKLSVPVEVMHQCTDPEEFHPVTEAEMKSCHHELLFVGNSREKHRKILKDIIPTKYELSVYGVMWEGIIDHHYIKGQHIPNHVLTNYYASADILLNDHWDSMREYGFVSNRIFDGLAAGAFIVSDRVKGIESLFPQGVLQTYGDAAELHDLVDEYLKNSEKRRSVANRGRDIVTQQHTFANRAKLFAESFEARG